MGFHSRAASTFPQWLGGLDLQLQISLICVRNQQDRDDMCIASRRWGRNHLKIHQNHES